MWCKYIISRGDVQDQAKYKEKIEAAMSALEELGKIMVRNKGKYGKSGRRVEVADRERSNNKGWLDEECKKNWKKEMNRKRK